MLLSKQTMHRAKTDRMLTVARWTQYVPKHSRNLMKMYDKISFIAKSIVLLLLLFIQQSTALAESTPDIYTTEELTALVQQWLEREQQHEEQSERQWQVQSLDARIGSKECLHPLELSLPGQLRNRQTTVQIRCNAPTPWQLYVPARFSDVIKAVVARQNLRPGTPITADMLQVEQRERRLLRGTIVTDPQQIIGARNRRSISLGQIVSLEDLCLVCRGDIVTINVNHATLNVSATGIAEQDGSLGDLISIRNRQSNQLIEAQVIAVNEVQVRY